MKALKGINFSAIAMSTIGNAGGLAVATQLNRIPIIQKQTNPKIKGAIMFIAGKVGVPLLAKAAGFTGNKGSEIVKGVSEGLAVYGIAQIGNSVAPNIFPAVSGYEEQPYRSLGLLEVEDQPEVSGADPYRDLSE